MLLIVFSSVQLLSHVQLFVTSRPVVHQVLLKLMSIESVMPSNHLILCCPLLLLSSIFPSISIFPSESVLHIRWPKDWKFTLTRQVNIQY